MPLNFQQAAPQLVEAFHGEETICDYYDEHKKVYVLVVSGESAAAYKNLVDAGKALEQVVSARTTKMISEALKADQQAKPGR